MINLKSVVTYDIEEQETVVNFARRDSLASVYTSDNTVLTKIQKLLNTPGTLWEHTNTYFNKDGEPTGYEFTAPKALVMRWSAKKKATKELTDEERKALGERLRGSKSNSTEVDEDLTDADEDDE